MICFYLAAMMKECSSSCFCEEKEDEVGSRMNSLHQMQVHNVSSCPLGLISIRDLMALCILFWKSIKLLHGKSD